MLQKPRNQTRKFQWYFRVTYRNHNSVGQLLCIGVWGSSAWKYPTKKSPQNPKSLPASPPGTELLRNSSLSTSTSASANPSPKPIKKWRSEHANLCWLKQDGECFIKPKLVITVFYIPCLCGPTVKCDHPFQNYLFIASPKLIVEILASCRASVWRISRQYLL